MSLRAVSVAIVFAGQIATMVLSNIHIIVGSRVEGLYGPLHPNPNPNVKRRVRSRSVGTVLRANGQHSWDVQFDFDGRVKQCSSKSLKVVRPEVGIPVNDLFQNDLCKNVPANTKVQDNDDVLASELDTETAPNSVVG